MQGSWYARHAEVGAGLFINMDWMSAAGVSGRLHQKSGSRNTIKIQLKIKK